MEFKVGRYSITVDDSASELLYSDADVRRALGHFIQADDPENYPFAHKSGGDYTISGHIPERNPKLFVYMSSEHPDTIKSAKNIFVNLQRSMFYN